MVPKKQKYYIQQSFSPTGSLSTFRDHFTGVASSPYQNASNKLFVVVGVLSL